MLLKDYHWMELLNICPDELRDLFSLCREYSIYAEYDSNGYGLADIQVLTYRILQEYKKVVYPNQTKLAPGERDKVNRELLTSLASWTNTDGTLKPMTTEGQMAFQLTRKEIPMPVLISIYLAPFDGLLIHSKIYDSYVEAHNEISCSFNGIFENILMEEIEHIIVKNHDWVGLARKMYNNKDVLDLCQLGVEYEDYMYCLNNRRPFVNFNDIKRLYVYYRDMIMVINRIIGRDYYDSYLNRSYNRDINLAYLPHHIYNSLLETNVIIKEREFESFKMITLNKVLGIFPGFQKKTFSIKDFNKGKTITPEHHEDNTINPSDLEGMQFGVKEDNKSWG